MTPEQQAASDELGRKFWLSWVTHPKGGLRSKVAIRAKHVFGDKVDVSRWPPDVATAWYSTLDDAATPEQRAEAERRFQEAAV